MAGIRISCPRSKAVFKANEAYVGKRSQCQKCGEEFVISRLQQDVKEVSADSTGNHGEVVHSAKQEYLNVVQEYKR